MLVTDLEVRERRHQIVQLFGGAGGVLSWRMHVRGRVDMRLLLGGRGLHDGFLHRHGHVFGAWPRQAAGGWHWRGR